MNHNSRSHVFVVGNEKGGAGKTTCSMHLIVGLLDRGYKVASIDTDSRQHSLTNYINNRVAYNNNNQDRQVLMPTHYHIHHIEENKELTITERASLTNNHFAEVLATAKAQADYIVIDTPGSHSPLSKFAHSHADTIITPINDSFLDIDVMAKINPDDLSIISPSIYSQMVWEQKIERAGRDQKSIAWIVMRNRLSNLDAVNKRNVAQVLAKLAGRINFKVISGFSERVIFRELFLQGLTLLDLTTANYDKAFSMSHVAARQELRDFLAGLGIKAA